MLLQGMVEQGMNRDRAKKNFWVCDKDGLLGQARKDVRRHLLRLTSSSNSSHSWVDV
jgi:malic enzyme